MRRQWLSILCIGFAISYRCAGSSGTTRFQFFVLDSGSPRAPRWIINDIYFQFFVLDSNHELHYQWIKIRTYLSILCIGFTLLLVENIALAQFLSILCIGFRDFCVVRHILNTTSFQFFVLDSPRTSTRTRARLRSFQFFVLDSPWDQQTCFPWLHFQFFVLDSEIHCLHATALFITLRFQFFVLDSCIYQLT